MAFTVWKALLCSTVLLQIYLILRLNGVFDPGQSYWKELDGKSNHLNERKADPMPHSPLTSRGNTLPPATTTTRALSKFGSHAQNKTCKPLARFIYIKTHKSGSSTLTNIFHRFAYNHNARVALPKGNYFLGWPVSERIPTSFVELPEQPEIWCSAHTRYNFKLLDGVIPNAVYVTVVRNPVSHFLSSWNYWRTEDHIRSNHPQGLAPSVDEFLEDPEAWWPHAKKSDRDLLQNNAAFDLGLNRESTEQDVRDLIAHMEEHFKMVLITEYMDESLVLLKRQFCWELEDVLYYSLKVVKSNPSRREVSDKMKTTIRKLSWMDLIIYNHFNATLWDKIAKEKDFFEEVAEFKRLKGELSQECIEWKDWSEDMHRKALLEGDPQSAQFRCHLSQLDSPGFVKFLKAKAGVPDNECHTQGPPRRRVVFIKTHKTASSTITNIMHRVAIRLRLRPVLPANNYYLGWPQLGTLDSSYSPLPNMAEGKFMELLCSAHARWDPVAMNKLVPDAVYVTILRDPVKHFQSSWDYWHISDHIYQRTGKRITMEEFLEDTKGNLHLLEQPDINVLQNSMVFDLGLPHEPTYAQVEELLNTLMYQFSLIMIQDYMDESMVMLRRQMCWTIDDVVHMPLKLAQGPPRAPVSEQVAYNIRKFNWADTMLFSAFNNTFWQRIKTEIDFKTELEQYRKEKKAVQRLCSLYQHDSDSTHRKQLAEANLKNPSAENKCRMRLLDSPGFVKLLKRRFGIKEKECHTQGRKRTKIAFIKTHKTGSSTLTNIFHRFALQNSLRVVLPKDNLFLGWPYLDIKSTVEHYGNSQTYEVFVSGHSRYNREHLAQLVPNAQYFTILRDPVAHFLSSWHHWHVQDHIAANGYEAPSLLEFVEKPEVWMNRSKWTDPWLIHNSMAFDMGLSNDPTQEQVMELVDHMNQQFSLVLITEMMDESLVILRRVLCWDMEDIAFLSLKVTPSEAQPKASQETIGLIEKMNSADMVLYSHFKSVLLARIAEEVDFEDELTELRTLKEKIAQDCREFLEYEEDRLRKTILDKTTEPEKLRCALMALDSKGFVKHLKKLSGVPFPECSSANTMPIPKAALIHLSSSTEDIFANILLRNAVRYDHNIVVPKSGQAVISLDAGEYDVVGRSRKLDPRFLATAPFTDPIPSVRNLFKPLMKVGFVVESPVFRFLSAWQTLDVAQTLSTATGSDITMETFLEDPPTYWQHLPSEARAALENPAARRFGLADDATVATGHEVAKSIYDKVDFFLHAEMLDESLIALRRWLCWNLDDVSISSAAISRLRPAVPEVSEAITTAIKKLSWADQLIYDYYDAFFRHYLDSLVDLDGEREQLLAKRKSLDAKCTEEALGDAEALMERVVKNYKTVDCDVMALSASEFHGLFRAIDVQHVE